MEVSTISRIQSSVAAAAARSPSSTVVQSTNKQPVTASLKASKLGIRFSSLNGKSVRDAVGVISSRGSIRRSKTPSITKVVRAEQIDVSTSAVQTFERSAVTVDEQTVTLKGEVILSRTIGTETKFSQPFPDFQSKIWFTLVSSDVDEHGQLKTSERTQIEEAGADTDDFYQLCFSVPSDFGQPGALLVESSNIDEFYLQTLILQGPNASNYTFACYSWINKTDEAGTPKEALEDYKKLFGSKDYKLNEVRIFFINKACLPKDTPAGLEGLRGLEMELMRGDGTGERKPADRIYEYDVYNDLGDPTSSPPSIRPTLGGPDAKFLYPRRCRTGREINEASGMEVPPPLVSVSPPRRANAYVPRDEDFSKVKASGNNADILKGIVNSVIPTLRAKFDETPDDFDTLLEVFDLYKDAGMDLFPKNPVLQPNEADKKEVEAVIKSSVLRTAGQRVDDVSTLYYPTPQILEYSSKEWMSDEEFGRQTIAGMHPVAIRRATTFPPTSSLPEDIYGHGTDLTAEDIDPYLITQGRNITAKEAIRQKRLFTIDYHDVYLPYVHKINHENLDERRFIYAPRAFFFLTDDQQLKPVAIELSLPSPQKGVPKAVNRVFTPPKKANQADCGWELAKLHFASVDFGFHELVSHWLKCHAVSEPFIIASHRQLSAMHPIFVLLEPSFVNTMRINANARSALIFAAPIGPIENNFTPGKYANELHAVAYDALWRFDKAGLPYDLLDRGMAELDPSEPEGVKLVFDDYPFAKDGLDVWNATKQYVTEYVKLYYKTDDAVASDEELQAWWKEIVEVGHQDKKDGWPSCKSIHNLIDIVCTFFYMTGPQHAGVNFGQYPYAGFMPNLTPMTRLPIPEPDTPEYKEMLFNFERHMLKTASSPQQTVSIMTILSALSVHAEDEEYVGERHNSHWTSDPRALEVFNKYSDEIQRLERMFKQRNANLDSKNRFGALKEVGYTLQYPKSGPGITGKGIPWSVSI